jgi:hypothetical protein
MNNEAWKSHYVTSIELMVDYIMSSNIWLQNITGKIPDRQTALNTHKVLKLARRSPNIYTADGLSLE